MTRVELLNSFHSKILKIADIITEEEMTAFLELKEQALAQEPMLDKIRAEIEEEYGYCNICEYFEDYDYEDNDISEYRYVASVKDILQIIDKYKAESEEV